MVGMKKPDPASGLPVKREGGEIIDMYRPASTGAPRFDNIYGNSMAKKKILFIDDEELLREAISELLEDMDFEVKVEQTGAEAVRTFAEDPGEFDLVLTDLMMLDMMGDEIAEKILSIRPSVPVVVMTGTPENLPDKKAEAMGICKVLGKPLTRAELGEAIRQALSHAC